MYTSSQSFAPMSRLMWKEYRAQRALWLAVCAFGVVPQVLFRLTLRHPADHVFAIWMMVLVMPIMFVIGSMAILFAGEREDRTDDWLRQMSVSPLWLLLAKWSFCVTATVALMAGLTMSALALAWDVPRFGDEALPAEAVARTAWMFAGLLLWGALGSLLSRRVVTAVPAMGLWWVLTLVVPVVWLPWMFGITYVHPWHERVQQILIATAFVGVGIADAWLGWRWCHGRHVDARVFDDGYAAFSQWLNRVWGRIPVRSRIPAGIEFDNAWRREWQRLIWQERHRESYQRKLLYLGCLISLLLARTSMFSGDLLSGVMPLVVLFPMTLAILGFRYDGEGQPLRFLANRGVSPHAIWLAKHVVWFPRAIWMPLTVWIVACVVQAVAPRVGFAGQNELLRVSAAAWEHLDVVLWYIALSYGCGHLAALCLRRVILGVVAAVALNLLAAAWMGLNMAFQVPIWWSVGGATVWVYGLSWWLAPYALSDRRELIQPWRLAAATLAPPLMLVTAFGLWRAFEIPGFQRSPDAVVYEAQVETGIQAARNAENAVLLRFESEINGSTSLRAIEQSDELKALNPDQRKLAARDLFWKLNEAKVDQIAELANHHHLHLGFGRQAVVGEWLLRDAGRLRTDEGRLDEALANYCAALRLAGMIDPADRGQAAELQLHILQQIVEWGNHPNQTAESLNAAAYRVYTELQAFPTMRESLCAQFARDRADLDDVFANGVNYEVPKDQRGLTVADILRLLPWERARAYRLLEQRLIDRDIKASDIAELLNRPGVDLSRVMELDNAPKRPNSLPEILLSNRAEPAGSLQRAMIEREVEVRETVLALLLLAWKKEHQEWPESLEQLLARNATAQRFPVSIAIDPWSGQYFEYHGNLRLVNDSTQTVELLATAGEDDVRSVPYRTAASGTIVASTSWRGEKRDPSLDNRLKLFLKAGRLELSPQPGLVTAGP
jgi:hypothetical protein